MMPQIKSRVVSYPDVTETAAIFSLKAMTLSFWIGFGSSIAASYAWELVRPNNFGCVTNTYRGDTIFGAPARNNAGNGNKADGKIDADEPTPFNFPL